MKRIIVLLSLWLYASLAFAVNWKIVSYDTTYNQIYVDLDSQVYYPDSGLAGTWALFKHNDNPQVFRNKIIYESMLRMNFNCNQRTSFVSESIFYDDEGRVIDSQTTTYHKSLETKVPPGTVVEAIFDSACAEHFKKVE